MYDRLDKNILYEIYNFNSQKALSGYLEFRINGHIDLVEDNTLAIVKSRIAQMKPNLSQDKIILSQSVEDIGQVYLKLL